MKEPLYVRFTRTSWPTSASNNLQSLLIHPEPTPFTRTMAGKLASLGFTISVAQVKSWMSQIASNKELVSAMRTKESESLTSSHISWLDSICWGISTVSRLCQISSYSARHQLKMLRSSDSLARLWTLPAILTWAVWYLAVSLTTKSTKTCSSSCIFRISMMISLMCLCSSRTCRIRMETGLMLILQQARSPAGGSLVAFSSWTLRAVLREPTTSSRVSPQLSFVMQRRWHWESDLTPTTQRWYYHPCL